ncbi:MAG: sulfotransferase [Leptolyngbya sp. SIO3F4]|nr:sulfotransferase [Leptolyngbya sp. SIO3F4]
MGLIKDFQDIGSVTKSVIFRRATPQTKFYIFGTGRCGSTLLVGLLNCHSQISCDPEILSAYSRVPKARLFKRVYHCPTSVYGFKLLMYHMIDVHRMQAPRNFLEWLHEQNFKVIYLRRKNRLQHAVSLVVSAKRKILHEQKSDQSVALKPIYLDPGQVLATVAKFEANYRAELELLKHLPHLSLVYEEHLASSQQHQRASNLVFEYLGLKSEPVEAKLKKIMPLDLSQSILNYEEVMAAIDQSTYAPLLA